MPTFATWSSEAEEKLEGQSDKDVIEIVTRYLTYIGSHGDYQNALLKSWQLNESLSALWTLAYAEDATANELLEAVDAFVLEVNKVAGVTTTPVSVSVPHLPSSTPTTREVERRDPAPSERKTKASHTMEKPAKSGEKPSARRRGVAEAEEKKPQRGAEAVRQQLAVHFDKVWNHLALGGESKGRPVGYHTICEAAQATVKIPEKYKDDPIKKGLHGTYKQWVIVKPKGNAKEKEPNSKDFSTFWPDSWTKQDIKDVCLSLPQFRFKHDMVVELATTVSGKNCAGLTVRLTEESFYPVIDD